MGSVRRRRCYNRYAFAQFIEVNRFGDASNVYKRAHRVAQEPRGGRAAPGVDTSVVTLRLDQGNNDFPFR